MTDLVKAQRRVLNATRAEADLLRAMVEAQRETAAARAELTHARSAFRAYEALLWAQDAQMGNAR